MTLFSPKPQEGEILYKFDYAWVGMYFYDVKKRHNGKVYERSISTDHLITDGEKLREFLRTRMDQLVDAAVAREKESRKGWQRA